MIKLVAVWACISIVGAMVVSVGVGGMLAVLRIVWSVARG